MQSADISFASPWKAPPLTNADQLTHALLHGAWDVVAGSARQLHHPDAGGFMSESPNQSQVERDHVVEGQIAEGVAPVAAPEPGAGSPAFPRAGRRRTWRLVSWMGAAGALVLVGAVVIVASLTTPRVGSDFEPEPKPSGPPGFSGDRRDRFGD